MSRNPDTLKEAADRRKQRQKMNKARGSDDPSAAPTDPRSSQGEASSGATSSGSQHPPEPAQPPSGKGGKGGKSSKGKESSKSKSKDKSKGKSKGKTDCLQIPRTMRISVFVLSHTDWIAIVINLAPFLTIGKNLTKMIRHQRFNEC